MRRRFFLALIAVLAGNILYRALLPHLPRAAQHRLFQIDLGLFVDCLLCTVFYGIIVWLERKS
jgi:hypothetical protein